MGAKSFCFWGVFYFWEGVFCMEPGAFLSPFCFKEGIGGRFGFFLYISPPRVEFLRKVPGKE